MSGIVEHSGQEIGGDLNQSIQLVACGHQESAQAFYLAELKKC